MSVSFISGAFYMSQHLLPICSLLEFKPFPTLPVSPPCAKAFAVSGALCVGLICRERELRTVLPFLSH